MLPTTSFKTCAGVLLLAGWTFVQSNGGRGLVPFWDDLAQRTDLSTAAGAKLVLLLIDTTGDTLAELFIAPAILCGTGGCEWSIYSPTGTKGQVRYLGQATFPQSAFLFDPSRRMLTFCAHRSAQSYELGDYRFERSRIIARDRGECRVGDSACEETLNRIRSWQRSSAPAVFEAVIKKDDVLDGLTWTTSDTRLDRTRPPDFAHVVVLQ